MTAYAFPHSSGSPQERATRPLPVTRQPFPEDARAVIYRPARSAMTSGKAPRKWKLRFERRTPPFIEPLMGWTGDDDTLAQVELSFPSAESAVEYARRQGLQYTRVVKGAKEAEPALEGFEHALDLGVIRQSSDPGAHPRRRYSDPQDVLCDPHLNPGQKRDLLQRWALDAYLLDLAFSSRAPDS